MPPLPSSMVAVTLSDFLVELGDFRAGEDLDALLLELLARDAGDLGILRRQDLRQHFHHGHLRAHGAIERRELDSDRAGADHQQRLRNRVAAIASK